MFLSKEKEVESIEPKSASSWKQISKISHSFTTLSNVKHLSPVKIFLLNPEIDKKYERL